MTEQQRASEERDEDGGDFCGGSVPENRERLQVDPADGGRPTAHVVLYQPEIPQNTGNIGRSCVAVGAKLWIVRPTGFRLDQRQLRRAGLDYWQHLQWTEADHWADLQHRLTQPDQAVGPRQWFFSRHAKQLLWDAAFSRGDVLVFGSETAGLPASILAANQATAVRLPTTAEVRSLNLATTVGIALYELLRQTRSPAHCEGR